MRKSRTWARSSKLEVDWDIFEEKRNAFERQNKVRRRFTRITEVLLEIYPNSRLAESINKDRKTRE